MNAWLGRRVGFVTVLVATGTARATDFTDYEWTVMGYVCVRPTAVVMKVCGPSGGDWADASFVAPLPGTFTMDLHYEVSGENPPSLWVGPFGFGSWCSPDPCSGDVLGIVVPVEANDVVPFSMHHGFDPNCYPGDGTTCTFTNLQFYPEPGVHPIGGAVSAAQLFTYDPNVTKSMVGGLVQLGDVNGDGRADWAVGDTSGVIPGPLGVVRVMSGLDGSVLHELKDPGWAGFGAALADVGDLDGDGADDLAVTETYWPGPKPSDALGRVHVVSGTTGASLFTLEGKQLLSEYGTRIDGVGDIDGDGVGDILVGAYQEEGPAGEQDAGAVRIYSGATQAILFEAYGSKHDYMGYDVAGTGDVNGDGTPDFAASAPEYATEDPTGVARVWSGGSAVLYSFYGTTSEVPTHVNGAGDVNADGHADILIGAPGAKQPGLKSHGAAAVRSGATGETLFKVSGTLPYELLGSFSAAAGDLDGDGFDDVLIGSPGPSVDKSFGRVHALAGPTGAPLFDIAPELLMSYSNLVDSGHDLDGDGTPDVLLKANTQVRGYSGVPAKHVLPVLAIDGSLLVGSPLALSLGNGPPGGTATLVIGLDPASLPFKGGVLVPSSDRLIPDLPLLPDGSLHLETTWPAGLGAPTVVFVQAWMPTTDAVHGFIATDALMLSPP